MTVAIIGSRSLAVDISKYIPNTATEIVSGGAGGIDSLAKAYANEMNIPIKIIRPEYNKYKKIAPLKRNEVIVNISDIIIAIWDGKSRGTKYTIDCAIKKGKRVEVYIIS